MSQVKLEKQPMFENPLFMFSVICDWSYNGSYF